MIHTMVQQHVHSGEYLKKFTFLTLYVQLVCDLTQLDQSNVAPIPNDLPNSADTFLFFKI